MYGPDLSTWGVAGENFKVVMGRRISFVVLWFRVLHICCTCICSEAFVGIHPSSIVAHFDQRWRMLRTRCCLLTKNQVQWAHTPLLMNASSMASRFSTWICGVSIIRHSIHGNFMCQQWSTIYWDMRHMPEGGTASWNLMPGTAIASWTSGTALDIA